MIKPKKSIQDTFSFSRPISGLGNYFFSHPLMEICSYHIHSVDHRVIYLSQNILINKKIIFHGIWPREFLIREWPGFFAS